MSKLTPPQQVQWKRLRQSGWEVYGVDPQANRTGFVMIVGERWEFCTLMEDGTVVEGLHLSQRPLRVGRRLWDDEASFSCPHEDDRDEA
jgi:hypothetical protein